MQPGAGINTYNGSRGLQRTLFEAQDHHNSMLRPTETDYDTYVKNMATGTGSDLEHGPKQVFSDYLFKTVLSDHIKTLYKTQRAAAEEAGFDDLYQNDRGRILNAKYHGTSTVGFENEHNFEDPWNNQGDGGTVWSAMYLDTTKDLPVASSSEELKAQLHQIEMYNDRTPKQRNYLAQKAQTRYWMQQVTNVGEGDTLMHFLYGRDFGVTNESGDPYGMHETTTTVNGMFDQLIKGEDESISWAVTDVQKGKWKSADEITGFAAPWQNAGENLLPTLTGALAGTDNAEFMSDYRREAYIRMSEEARKHVGLARANQPR